MTTASTASSRSPSAGCSSPPVGLRQAVGKAQASASRSAVWAIATAAPARLGRTRAGPRSPAQAAVSEFRKVTSSAAKSSSKRSFSVSIARVFSQPNEVDELVAANYAVVRRFGFYPCARGEQEAHCAQWYVCVRSVVMVPSPRPLGNRTLPWRVQVLRSSRCMCRSAAAGNDGAGRRRCSSIRRVGRRVRLHFAPVVDPDRIELRVMERRAADARPRPKPVINDRIRSLLSSTRPSTALWGDAIGPCCCARPVTLKTTNGEALRGAVPNPLGRSPRRLSPLNFDRRPSRGRSRLLPFRPFNATGRSAWTDVLRARYGVVTPPTTN